MKDTTDSMQTLVAVIHSRMSSAERCQAASAMFDVAVAIVDSSLPSGLSARERRLARARRLYGDDLPEAALHAYASYVSDAEPVAAPTV